MTSATRIRTTLEDRIAEKSSPPIRLTFVDDAGVAVQPDAATLTLHLLNGTVINTRAAVDLLPSTTAGVCKFVTVPADFAIQGTAVTEVHIALIEWTWTDDDGDTRYDKHEIVHTVENLVAVA